MAGAGFKTFTTGEVLLAADVNQYLMQQTVMVFDDASARATAIPTPSEGMFSYLKDTNLTYRYDGSAWLSDAGTTSPLTTKGDVWGYSTTDARIPVGANGTVLTADSAEALGVKWAVDPVADIATTAGDILYATAADTLTRLGIGTAGQVLKVNSGATAPEWGAASSTPTFVGCYVSKTANQSTANTTYVQLSFDNEVIDTDGFHDNVTNNSRITIPSGKGGKYFLSGTVLFATNGTGSRTASMYKNGSSIGVTVFATQSGDEATATVNVVADLVAGDYIELYSRQKSGGNLDVVGGNPAYTYLIAYLIGA